MVHSMVTFLSVEKKRRQHSLDDFCFAFHDFVGFFFFSLFLCRCYKRGKNASAQYGSSFQYIKVVVVFFNIHDGHLGWRDVDDVGR